MALINIRTVFLPYCIRQVEKGHFVILNREYKPLGTTSNSWVDYKNHMVRMKGITKNLASRIDVEGRPDTDNIYLYNDGCVPTRSPIHAAAYFARLAMLMPLMVATEDTIALGKFPPA